jgi:hypothetical protein
MKPLYSISIAIGLTAAAWITVQLMVPAVNSQETGALHTLVPPAWVNASRPMEEGASASVTTQKALPPSLEATRYWLRCLEVSACVDQYGSRNNSLDAHFQVVQQAEQALRRLSQAGLTEKELGEAAEWALRSADGHVHAAALDLLALTRPTPEQVQAVTAALEHSFDSTLIRKALPLLQRWHQQGLCNSCERMMVLILKDGGLYAGQVVAQSLLPFLSPGNVETFKATANELPADSLKKRHLEQTLEEYQRLSTGG